MSWGVRKSSSSESSLTFPDINIFDDFSEALFIYRLKGHLINYIPKYRLLYFISMQKSLYSP